MKQFNIILVAIILIIIVISSGCISPLNSVTEKKSTDGFVPTSTITPVRTPGSNTQPIITSKTRTSNMGLGSGSENDNSVPKMTAKIEASGNVVYIYHNGGDPFQKEHLLIRINGEDIQDSQISLLHSQDWPWTAGKTIKVQYSGSSTPNNVQIIYTDGKNRVVIVNQIIRS